jgi:hypothetical protein
MLRLENRISIIILNKKKQVEKQTFRIFNVGFNYSILI